jgi:hypothetical protein
MPDTTDRVGIPFPELDELADGPLYMGALAQHLDTRVALDDQGPIASRPISTPAAPGTRGRYYFGTDTGLVYRDHGTGWTIVTRIIGEDEITNFEIAPLTVRSIELADNAVIRRTVGDLAIGAAEIDNSVVGYTHVANGLKPSQGAGAAQESLRALGNAPGMAAAGIHGSTHRPNGADPLLDTVLTVAQFKALAPQHGMIAHVNVGGTDASVWTLMYDAAIGDAYKWHSVGGPSLVSEYAGTIDMPLVPGSWQVTPCVLSTPLTGLYRTQFDIQGFINYPGGYTLIGMWAGLNYYGIGINTSLRALGDATWGTYSQNTRTGYADSHDVARVVGEGQIIQLVTLQEGDGAGGNWVRLVFPRVIMDPIRVSQ